MINEVATLAQDEIATEVVTAVRKRKHVRRTPIAIVEAPKVKAETSAATKSRRTRQFRAGAFVGSIGIVLTAISISHLATGIEAVTHCNLWEAWAMSIGIDLGFVGFKACDICGYTEDAKHANETYGKLAIIGTLLLSACLNGLTFSSAADGYGAKAAAIALGIAIPALVFAAFKVSSALLINTRKAA